MATDLRTILRDQCDVAWSLFEYHAEALTDEVLLWSPSAHQWTMRQVDDRWRADLAKVEPDPVPVTTIAWLTWHMGWWWSTATAHLAQTPAPSPDEIQWPESASEIIRWLDRIHVQWQQVLADTERLDDEASYPWPEGSGKTLADMAAWVNVELTKNIAEIGQLLVIRRAREYAGDN